MLQARCQTCAVNIRRHTSAAGEPDEAARSLTVLRTAFAALFASSAVATAASGPPPADAPLPRTAAGAAQALVSTSDRLGGEVEAWRKAGVSKPPDDVTLDALYQERIYRLLAANAKLARATIPRLARYSAFAHDVITAHRELASITPPLQLKAIRVGPAAPPADLLRFYREGQRRFGVAWNVLAAVNFVESAFGKLRSASAAGAQGPMQFMPSSWRTYGLGGNVHDPHDAILGAANYLRAAGARRDIRAALHAYNPSRYYVDAVLRYARDITADVDNFYDFYAWQVYVKTPSGSVRLTGPGLHNGHSPTRENPRRS
jgi:membrane-bound lytic murein transglycosylase B